MGTVKHTDFCQWLPKPTSTRIAQTFLIHYIADICKLLLQTKIKHKQKYTNTSVYTSTYVAINLSSLHIKTFLQTV